MKKVNLKLGVILLGSAILASSIVSSCSKSDNPTPPPVGPVAPSNPGDYDSAAQISSATLVAYFPFNGSYNDVKGGLTGAATGATFGTGIKGQAYQGAGKSFVSYTSVGALKDLKSYTLSAWYKIANKVSSDTGGIFTPDLGTQGIFSMYDNVTGDPNLLLLELEPYSPVSGDSVRVHAGFNNTGNTAGAGWKGVIPEGFLDTAVGKWTHVVMTYDGGSSKYSLYQNGTLIAAASAWSSKTDLTPLTVLNGPTGDATTGPMGNLNFVNVPAGFIIGGWPYNSINDPKFGEQVWAGYLQGNIDELRIYSNALNSTDVKSLYILEKAGF